MDFTITSDANAESGLTQVVIEISGPTKQHFVSKTYGSGLRELGVVLTCRDPDLAFRQRLRFVKTRKLLLMDIMFDLREMMRKAQQLRKQIVIQRLGEEIPEVLEKYKLGDFDERRFVEDLHSWLRSIQTPQS